MFTSLAMILSGSTYSRMDWFALPAASRLCRRTVLGSALVPRHLWLWYPPLLGQEGVIPHEGDAYYKGDA